MADKKAIILLSGGIDSSLVASIAVDALGKDNVVGVTMPSPYTSNATLSDARLLASNLKIDLVEIPIQTVYQSYQKALENFLEETNG